MVRRNSDLIAEKIAVAVERAVAVLLEMSEILVLALTHQLHCQEDWKHLRIVCDWDLEEEVIFEVRELCW